MTAEVLTYYDVLHLNRGAEPQRVRTAYRKLAQQYHPDKMPGNADAPRIMAALNEAYAVLSDPRQRALYDEHIERIRASRERARECFIEQLEDQGASWPWYLIFATVTCAAGAVGVSMWPALIAAHLR